MWYIVAFLAGAIVGFVAAYLYSGKAVKGLKDTVDVIAEKKG